MLKFLIIRNFTDQKKNADMYLNKLEDAISNTIRILLNLSQFGTCLH